MIPPTAATVARLWPFTLTRAVARRWLVRAVLSWAALELVVNIRLH